MTLNPFNELTPLSLYKDLFWSLITAFNLKSVLSDKTMVNPGVFWFPLALKQPTWGSVPPEKFSLISN